MFTSKIRVICKLGLFNHFTGACRSMVNTRSTSNKLASIKTENIPEKHALDLEVNRIVWMDMEMTGLNIEKDQILELASVVTDTDLNVIATGPELIIHQPTSILNSMNEWCVQQHGKTGLTEASKNSQITLKQAEDLVLEFISKHVTEKASPLAGNSVYTDRVFLRKYMPRIDDYLHYRIIDVSSIKELCRRWNPNVYKKAPVKNYTHRAISDIFESIEELKYYKQTFLNCS